MGPIRRLSDHAYGQLSPSSSVTTGDTPSSEDSEHAVTQHVSPSSVHHHHDTTSSQTTPPDGKPVSTRCPSRYDWSKHMSTIKRLYIDEDKTLKEVMEIMDKEYNLVATARMYKIRLKKWGFSKNVSVKAEEVESLLGLIVEEESQGDVRTTSTEVMLATGRVVGLGRLAAHLRRKRIPATDIRKGPQLSVALRNHYGAPSPTSLNIDSPDVFRVTEVVFGDINAYVSARIKDPVGAWSGTSPPERRQIFSTVHATRDFLLDDKIDEALAVLRGLPDQIKTLLYSEPYEILDCFFLFIVQLMSNSWSEQIVGAMRALINFAALTAAEEPLGWSPQYPVRRILNGLSTLSRSEDFAMPDMALNAWKCLLSAHDSAVGFPACAKSFGKWLDLSNSAGFDALPASYLDGFLWHVYDKNAAELGAGDRETWTGLFWLAELERQKVKARNASTEKLQDLYDLLLQTIPVGEGLNVKLNCHYYLADIHKSYGRRALAERHLCDAIDTRMELFGAEKHDPIVLQFMTKLEAWLTDWGEEAKVEEVHQRRNTILALLKNDTN